MDNFEKYVRRFLSSELNVIENDPIFKLPDKLLSVFEKAIIFKYSTNGYIKTNESLRVSQGRRYKRLGLLLENVLHKLPNYNGLVYRGVNLTDRELQRYIDAEKNDIIMVEHSFISTSKSIAISYFTDKKVKFTIISKTGKDIEAYSKYGKYTDRNEKEVLYDGGNLNMTTLEHFKTYNIVKKSSDIKYVTDLIYDKILIKDFNKNDINQTETVLNSFVTLLENLLNLPSALSKKDKVEIIHMLDDFKLQQEIIEISKKSLSDDQFLINLKKASIHLGKKSQSAFETK
jgi:hypothetical protein